MTGLRHTRSVGDVAGIAISVHISWLLIMGAITASLALGYFPWRHPEFTLLCSWSISLAAACLLFLTLLAHELAHALIAQWNGIKVEGICLFCFGGLAMLRREPDDPGLELRLAVVGPLTSLTIGALFGMFYLSMVDSWPLSPLTALFEYLAIANFGLAFFNLLPSFPLDGGHMVHAGIWALTGSAMQATWWAMTLAQIVAVVVTAYGSLRLIGLALSAGQPSSEWVSALWTIIIGCFLSEIAHRQRGFTEHSEPTLDASRRE